MPKKAKRTTVCTKHRANLETILRAARDGNLALLEVRVRATGEIRAALVAVGFDGTSYVPVPFALMIDGNPYDQLDPPNPDGGFHTADNHKES